jgi:hypothetical protein
MVSLVGIQAPVAIEVPAATLDRRMKPSIAQ